MNDKWMYIDRPKISFEDLRYPGVGELCVSLMTRHQPGLKILAATPLGCSQEPLEIPLPGPTPTYHKSRDIDFSTQDRIPHSGISGCLFAFLVLYTEDGVLKQREFHIPSGCSTLLELLYREAATLDAERKVAIEKALQELNHVAPYQGPTRPEDR